jgi:thiamine biosynthesis lipoprotein
MGMPVSIHVRGAQVGDADTGPAVRAAFAELARMDGLFTTYDDGSHLCRVRRGELGLDRADPLIAELWALGGRRRS